MTVSADQAYVQNTRDVSSEFFDGEVVLVNFVTGRYFALRGAGVDCWARLKVPASAPDIARDLSAAYGVPAERTAADVGRLVEALLAEGLIFPAGGAADDVPEMTPSTSEYAAPALETFDELEELIALDPIHDTDPDAGWPLLPQDGQ